jgi:hypothetical protein
MDLHSAAAALIVNQTQLSKPIHEKTDPRPGGAHDLCQALLTDLGDYSLRHAFLAEVSKPQQNPAQYSKKHSDKKYLIALMVENVSEF